MQLRPAGARTASRAEPSILTSLLRDRPCGLSCGSSTAPPPRPAACAIAARRGESEARKSSVRNRFNDGQGRRGRGPSSSRGDAPPTRSTRSATCGTRRPAHVRVRLPAVCQLHLAVADARLQGGVPSLAGFGVRARLLLHNDAAGVPGRGPTPRTARRSTTSRWLAARLFYLMLTIWNGAPAARAYVRGHNLSHHKYLQTRRDIMRTNKVNFGSQALNIIAFFPSILGSIQSNDFKYMHRCGARDGPPPAARSRRAAAAAAPAAAPAHFRRLKGSPLASRSRPRPPRPASRAQCGADSVPRGADRAADRRLAKALLIYFRRAASRDMLVSLNLLQHDGGDAKSKYNRLAQLHLRRVELGLLQQRLGHQQRSHACMKPGVHWSLAKRGARRLVAPPPPQPSQAFDRRLRHRQRAPWASRASTTRPRSRPASTPRRARRALVLRAGVDQRHLLGRRRVEGGPEGGASSKRTASGRSGPP